MKNMIALIGLVLLVALMAEAQARCYINISVQNTGDYRTEIYNNSIKTGVRNKIGSWKSLKSGGWFYSNDYDYSFVLDVDQVKGDQYGADFGCNAERRYRIKYSCKGGIYKDSVFTEYFPSATGFTTKQDFTIKIDKCK